MTREEADVIALDFMNGIPNTQPMSLDEFLCEYEEQLTQEQRERGYDILSWYPEYGGVEFEEETNA